MPDTDVTYYKRRDRVKPVTKRELDTFAGLAETLKAQGWKAITPAQAAKIADPDAVATTKEN